MIYWNMGHRGKEGFCFKELQRKEGEVGLLTQNARPMEAVTPGPRDVDKRSAREK